MVDNKKRILRFFIVAVIILIMSYSFCNIEIYNNNFLFIIPFILFCFMNNKLYGVISFAGTFVFLGYFNSWFYLCMILVVTSLVFIKFFLKGSEKKVGSIVSFLSFSIVFLEGILSNLIYNTNYYLLSFVVAVISYWVMKSFYELYIAIHVRDEKYFLPRESAFIIFLIGVVILGLNIHIWKIDVSLVMIVLLAIIASKIDFELGILYTFLMFIISGVIDDFSFPLIILFGICCMIVLLNKASKLVLFFTYVFGIVILTYYLSLDYYLCFNYCLSILVYLFIPDRYLQWLAKKVYGSEKYISKLEEDNKKYNLKVSNQILKMGEIFSLVSGKLKVDERIKKNDKKLMVEEIRVFNELMKSYSKEIKENYKFRSDYKIEKELYKCGFDLLYFNVMEDVFSCKKISIGIRCSEKEIGEVIIPLINKEFKSNFEFSCIEENEIFDFKEIVLKEKKFVNFEFGVSQKAKDGLVCGDSYLIYENSEKKLFALSDGMGYGKEAKERSKAALDLLKKFLDVGFEEKQTLSSINCILKKEYYKEGYATLDLLIYDKVNNKLYFSKNGACNSYLVKGESISEIEGNNLPLGIVDKINFEFKEIDIETGYVIMVSDGVDENICSEFDKLKDKSPQKNAKDFIRDSKDIIDDQSIIVIKIKK